MVVGGLHMHFQWFKGFITVDYQIKCWGRKESVVISGHWKPVYTLPEEDNSYQDPSIEIERPVDMMEEYFGKRSWIFPMYSFLAAIRLESKLCSLQISSCSPVHT
jgi:hypothetical protein